METNREIRKRSFALLRSHWQQSVCASFLATLLGGVNALALLIEVPVLLLLPVNGNRVRLVISAILTAHILLSALIGGMIELGHDRYYLKLCAGESPQVSEIFSLRQILSKGMWMRFIICGETMIRLVLLIVPGIVVQFQYALLPFLVAQNPNSDPSDTTKTSSVLMKGYKNRLWSMIWSFFPWFLLCICTAGIGFLFFIPYCKICLAEFYRQRVAEHDAFVRQTLKMIPPEPKKKKSKK
jgi:hypothetical protein